MNNTNPPRRRPGTSTGSASPGAPRRPVSGAAPAARRPGESPSKPSPAAAGAQGAKLVCTAGPKAGNEFALTDEEVVIGRANEVTISVPDTSVSRRHAQLRKVGGGWALSDLGSGNGTEVNGNKITEETAIRNGDVISLGDTEFSFVDSSNTTDRHALPVRRAASGAGTALPPPPVRRGASGTVRPRVSRSNIPDPEAIARKKKLQLYAVLSLLVVVSAFAGIYKLKQNKLDKANQEAAIERNALNHVSEIFQEGTKLVREGNWNEALQKFLLVKKVKPDYPGVDDYIQRGQKEIPNQQHLTAAEDALKDNRLGDAAAELAKVTSDTQLYDQLSKDKVDLDSKVPDRINVARTAFDSKKYQDAIDISADVLKAAPDNRDAKLLNDEATKTLYDLKHPPPPKPPPPARPWEAVIARYVDGDLTGSVALANACAAKGFPRCKTLMKQLAEFAELNKRAEDLRAKDLKKLLQLDRDISEGKGSKLARSAGVRASNMLYQQASAAKVAGSYGKAADALRQALQIDPHNGPAQAMLAEIKSKAHDVYMLAYSLKDTQPDEAITKFRDVIQMTPSDDEDHAKAQSWIEKLSKQ